MLSVIRQWQRASFLYKELDYRGGER